MPAPRTTLSAAFEVQRHAHQDKVAVVLDPLHKRRAVPPHGFHAVEDTAAALCRDVENGAGFLFPARDAVPVPVGPCRDMERKVHCKEGLADVAFTNDHAERAAI